MKICIVSDKHTGTLTAYTSCTSVFHAYPELIGGSLHTFRRKFSENRGMFENERVLVIRLTLHTYTRLDKQKPK